MCSVIGMQREGSGLLAGSYDFYFHHGLIVTNRRGLLKRGLAKTPPVLEWESRYGSVTLNQFGRELPSCGMNETGLAIHKAQLLGNECPSVLAGRPRLNELQWIQYQLDHHASVEEVIAALDEAPIERGYVDLHYALCDRHGDLAVIESVAGDLRALRPAATTGLVMTNHSVADVLAPGIGNGAHALRLPGHGDSGVRYLALQQRLEARERGEAPPLKPEVGLPEDAELYFLAACLAAVRRNFSLWKLLKWHLFRVPPAYTCWNTLFDPRAATLHFRTVRFPAWRRIDLARVDYSPSAPSLCLDLDADLQGDVTQALFPVRRQDNARIIYESYKPLGPRISEDDIEALIDYPDQFEIIEGA